SARARGFLLRDPDQRLGSAEDRAPCIDPGDELAGGIEHRRDAVGLSVLRVVEPAAFPAVRPGGPQVRDYGQAAEPAIAQLRIRIPPVLVGQALGIAWVLQPGDTAA